MGWILPLGRCAGRRVGAQVNVIGARSDSGLDADLLRVLRLKRSVQSLVFKPPKIKNLVILAFLISLSRNLFLSIIIKSSLLSPRCLIKFSNVLHKPRKRPPLAVANCHVSSLTVVDRRSNLECFKNTQKCPSTSLVQIQP